MSLTLREGYGVRSERGKVALSVVAAEDAAHLPNSLIVAKMNRMISSLAD